MRLFRPAWKEDDPEARADGIRKLARRSPTKGQRIASVMVRSDLDKSVRMAAISVMFDTWPCLSHYQEILESVATEDSEADVRRCALEGFFRLKPDGLWHWQRAVKGDPDDGLREELLHHCDSSVLLEMASQDPAVAVRQRAESILFSRLQGELSEPEGRSVSYRGAMIEWATVAESKLSLPVRLAAANRLLGLIGMSCTRLREPKTEGEIESIVRCYRGQHSFSKRCRCKTCHIEGHNWMVIREDTTENCENGVLTTTRWEACDRCGQQKAPDTWGH